MGLNDIGGRTAGIGYGVVESVAVRYMLAHKFDAHIHELDRVERGAASFRSTGCVACYALE